MVPSLDVVDSLIEKRDALLKLVGGDTLAAPVMVEMFADLIEHVQDERRQWELTLTLFTDEELDYEDWLG